jgi:nicotinamide-nucleotide amidase
MNDNVSVEEISYSVVRKLLDASKTFASAESCTGGWIAKIVTDIPGASRCFSYGIVSYSNGAKESLLGVSPQTLESFGAVSEETVREMADGALRLSGADFAVAVSGIAGPDGGSAEKPVGTVCFGWAERSGGGTRVHSARKQFQGDRMAVREQSVVSALQGLSEMLDSPGPGPMPA